MNNSKRERIRAIFAKFKSRASNVGRQISPQYRSDRELSESEFRSKHRTRRGALLGAAAGAGVFGLKNRKNPMLKESLAAAKQSLGRVGDFILQTGHPRGAASVGVSEFARSPAFRAMGKRATPYILGGAVLGGLTRATTNPEHVQKIKPKKHVDQTIKRESTVRVRRVR